MILALVLTQPSITLFIQFHVFKGAFESKMLTRLWIVLFTTLGGGVLHDCAQGVLWVMEGRHVCNEA